MTADDDETIHRSSGWLGFDSECDPSNNDTVEATVIMRALEPEVFDAVWTAIEGLIPRFAMITRSGVTGCWRSLNLAVGDQRFSR